MESIEETSWHSYPKIYALGHRLVKPIFDDRVIIEEKVDGSQFSFGLIGGELKVRSKGKVMHVDAPESLFERAVETVKGLDLHPEWTYRGECLNKPKHNTLAYDRVPHGNVILFDINDGHESYLPYDDILREGDRLGLETVPIMFDGILDDIDQLKQLLKWKSILGGQTVEGVVIKSINQYIHDGHLMMGKFVSEEFKEVHQKSFKDRNPGNKGIIDQLIDRYKTEARWNKAVQHLRDLGALENEPRDIPKILIEIKKDFGQECKDEVKELLWKWAYANIQRGISGGVAEWYKDKLLDSQFEKD